MPGGLGPRFALEAGFLILLAGVAAYARLSATEIILVMSGGWLLASIFEVVAAQRERLYPGATWERRGEAEDASVEEERPRRERRLSWFRRPVDAAPQPADAAVVSEPETVEPVQQAAEADDETTGEFEGPRPRRRWFRRSRREREVPADEVSTRPSARHVRLIRGSTSEADVEERTDAEAGS